MNCLRMGLFAVASIVLIRDAAQGQIQKPNILVIFDDDIGISNISAYSDGLMGLRVL